MNDFVVRIEYNKTNILQLIGVKDDLIFNIKFNKTNILQLIGVIKNY